MAEAIELCETARRGGAPVGQPALPLLGAVRARAGRATTPATSTARSRRARRARASAGGWPAARCPSAGGGPGWALGVRAASRPASVERALRDDARARRRGRCEHKIPVERCFDWEMLALVELALGRPEAADALRRRARSENAARARPAAAGGARRPHARARCCSPRGEPLEAARRRASVGGRGRDAIGARLQAAFSRAAAGRALAAAGERARRDRGAARGRARARRVRVACACATRCAASCASSARAPSRAGRRPAEDSGSASLTQARAARSPTLVTDRKTNREIAGDAVPQRQDGRVAHAQHLRQARRLLARRGRARGRARAARARRTPA